MIDVLMYLYETYWRPDACPAPEVLSRKLSAVGFERDEIEEALGWLKGLAQSAVSDIDGQHRSSLRVYARAEQLALGTEGVNLLVSLEAQGRISPTMRELVVERALSSGCAPIELDDLKVMLLIVFWCLDQEPDQLVFDDLFDDSDTPRTYH